MDERARAAALMQQRLARSQGNMPMEAAPPARRRVHFAPGLDQTPSQSARQLQPTAPGVPPVSRVTGSGPMMIPPRLDPANQYNNSVEKMDASAEASAETYPGINLLVRMLVLALLLGTMFVIPQGFKPFWITIVGLVILSYIGFALYFEFDRKAFSSDGTTEDKEKYKTWAIGILYFMNVSVTMVVVAIMIVMVWRIYGLTVRRTNLLSAPEDTPQEEEVQQVESHVEGRHSGRERHRRKSNRRPFV